MNANELADELEKLYRFKCHDAATMLRQQQSELDSLRSIVYWIKENRPEVWDDIKKWSKM